MFSLFAVVDDDDDGGVTGEDDDSDEVAVGRQFGLDGKQPFKARDSLDSELISIR